MKYINVVILFLACVLASTVRAQKPMDLGLSVRWADRNIGADSPEQYGCYLAWGEVKPKRHYGKYSGYKHFDEAMLHKYNYGDNLLELEPKDDAATVRLGKKWRMPTEAEVKELISKCRFKKVRYRGANVYKVWNPTYAQSDTIYIPCCGYKDYGNYRFSAAISAYCWTSTLIGDEIRNDSIMQAHGSSYVYNAKCLMIAGDGTASVGFWERRNGCAVRAVTN